MNLRWFSRARRAAAPVAVDGLIIVACLLEIVTVSIWGRQIDVVAASVAVMGLTVRRRWPSASVLLSLPGLALDAAVLAGPVALYSFAVQVRSRRKIVLVGLVSFIARVQPWSTFDVFDLPFSLRLLNDAMFITAPVALGMLVSTRADLSERVRDLAQMRQNERELIYNEALAAERTRLAREMHDVVSHQVSLIAVQAGALQVSAALDSEVALASERIRLLAVRTLEELRQMVHVLRLSAGQLDTQHPHPEAALLPQPTINDLRELVNASHPDALLSIDLPPLPLAHQRSLYRTLQEGLTNARKHAPGSSVSINLAVQRNLIVLTIENERSHAAPMELPGSGQGLFGLRERAKLLGGDIYVVEDVDRFRLTMKVPLPRPATIEER